MYRFSYVDGILEFLLLQYTVHVFYGIQMNRAFINTINHLQKWEMTEMKGDIFTFKIQGHMSGCSPVLIFATERTDICAEFC